MAIDGGCSIAMFAYRTGEAGSPIPEATKRRDKFYPDIHIWYIDGEVPMKSKIWIDYDYNSHWLYLIWYRNIDYNYH